MQTISRQEFLSLVGSGVGAAIFLPCLSGCSKGADPDPGTQNSVDETLNLADSAYKELQTDGWQYVMVDGKNLIVARSTQGTYLAVSSECTHEQAQLIYQPSNNSFLCPRHSSRFTADGKVVNGPASSPLKKYDTTFDSAKNTLRIVG